MAGILTEDTDNFLYVTSIEEAHKLVAEFETRSTTKFSCFEADKHWYVSLVCIIWEHWYCNESLK